MSEPTDTPTAGRSCLVVGGNRGIGLAVAEQLRASGERVAITLREGKAPDGMYGVRCDVRDSGQVDAAFDAVEAEHGPVEVLVVNAGIVRDRTLLAMPEESFHEVLDTNLVGAYRTVRRATKGMLRLRRGRVVLISSTVALQGSAGQSNYAAAKAGLIGFGRSMARELASRGVTVNIVLPGLIETRMTSDLPPVLRKRYLAEIPLRRSGLPHEVAHTVAHLASADAGYVTGAVVPVDGGAAMGH